MGHNSFEGGLDGTNISTANSGGASGDPISNIVLNNVATNGGGAAFKYRAASAIRGAMGWRLIPQAANTYFRFDVSEGGTRFYMQLPFDYVAAPSTPVTLLWIQGVGGVIAGLSIRADGKVGANNGSSNIAASNSPTALTPGKYFFRLAVTPGTGIGNLEIEVVNALTDEVVYPWTNPTSITIAAGPPTQYRFVNATTASGWAVVDGDDAMFGALASGWPEFPAEPLETPALTLAHTDVTSIGGSDGTITATWPAVDGADHYELAFMNGHVTSGAVATDPAATSPESFSALPPGEYTIAVRACV